MTCPYCKHEIRPYQKPYRLNNVDYHNWCAEDKIRNETREQVASQPKEPRSSDE